MLTFRWVDAIVEIKNNSNNGQVNGKLHVSLTRVKDGTSLVVSQFDTREEVIEVRQHLLPAKPYSFIFSSGHYCLLLASRNVRAYSSKIQRSTSYW